MTTLTDKTVLVTGASGFTGGALARRLAAEGARARALVRRPERAGYIRDIANIEIVQGDITDAACLREIMQGCVYVFHTAVSYGGWDEQHRVNVEGTRCVMEAAADAGVERVVHVSSMACYGYDRSGLLTEDFAVEPMPHEPYNASKVKAEYAVREVGAQRGLSYSIIRPGLIYGPRSGQWTDMMFQVAKMRPLMWIGDGSGTAYPIHVDDVVDMMLVLATHPAAHNETFNCVCTPPSTWRAFIGAYARLVDNDSWVGLPVLPVILLARLIAFFSPPHTNAKDAHRALYGAIGKGYIDMRKARDLLGWQPRIMLEEGIASCVPYLREKGLLE